MTETIRIRDSFSFGAEVRNSGQQCGWARVRRPSAHPDIIKEMIAKAMQVIPLLIFSHFVRLFFDHPSGPYIVLGQ